MLCGVSISKRYEDGMPQYVIRFSYSKLERLMTMFHPLPGPSFVL